jgi:molecular chaperone DnaK
MVKDAEAHAEEDKKRREEADVRNAGDSLVYQTEKFIKDNEEKLSEGDSAAKKADVEAALVDLKKLLEGADFEAIKKATETVATKSQELGASLYASQGASQEAPKADENVEDAEIVEEQ